MRKRFLNEMDDHLGVRLGAEGMPASDQARFECQVVLHDAVVNHCDAARLILMGMRVRLGDAAMRGPARVPEAHRALGENRARLPDLADMLLDIDPLAVADGDPPGVIAT